jgi:hypothetical protein
MSKTRKSQSLLAHDEFKNWRHMCFNLREYENIVEQITNMNKCIELRTRLQKEEAIDKDL